MPTLNTVTQGAFCRELVCGLDDLDTILNDWGLTKQEFLELKRGEAFQKELMAAVDDVRAMGPDSTFIVRCKVLSEMFLENVVGMMGDRMVPAEVKASLFKHVTELARLQPPKNSPQTQGPAGPLVTFTFGPGMPGMPEKLVVEAQQPQQLEQSE